MKVFFVEYKTSEMGLKTVSGIKIVKAENEQTAKQIAVNHCADKRITASSFTAYDLVELLKAEGLKIVSAADKVTQPNESKTTVVGDTKPPTTIEVDEAPKTPDKPTGNQTGLDM